MAPVPGTVPHKAGFCGILGLPNVGKSTLLNRALGLRLAAVSARPQTTRNRIVGVHNIAGEIDAQIVLVDTPGIQQGKGALRRYMREQALAAVGDCDVALLMVDVTDYRQRDPARLAESPAALLAHALGAASTPAILAVNKIDQLADKAELLPIMAAYDALGSYAEIRPISARTGDGVDELVAAIARRLPEGPRLFPEDMYTDRAERFLAAELIREQLFRQLGQELPYASAVVVDSFRERADKGDIVIEAVVYVERESQKGMVVGKGGHRIKSVGERARKAISQLFGCPVHVVLQVKVSADWSRGERGIRDMGYE